MVKINIIVKIILNLFNFKYKKREKKEPIKFFY